MKRTTVLLPDELDEKLRREATRRGVPVASLVRDAVERFLPDDRVGSRLSFFAVADGEPTDVAEHSREMVADAVRRRSRGRHP